MKITFFLAIIFATNLFAQTAQLRGTIKDEEHQNPLPGATVFLEKTSFGTSSDAEGAFSFDNVPAGLYTLRVSLIGYAGFSQTVTLKAPDHPVLEIFLSPVEVEEEEVVVTGTRTARHIADVPVRIEAIPQEEVEEKILMTPASTAMLLNEATGARVQTVSSAGGALNLRIQGLSGRYTQILLDGVPNFSGLAAGLGLTQLAPLNLRQVEIVKGAGSALYGADAIAGVVNFITKEPRETPEVSVLLNATTQKGFDAAAYYGRRIHKLGYTLFASKNLQSRFDVDGDGFADNPEYDKLTVAPKLTYQLSERAQLTTSLGIFHEDRLGGAANATRAAVGTGKPYLEEVKSNRVDAAAQLAWNLGDWRSFTAKVAGMRLKREAFYGDSPFNATQALLYAEAQYAFAWGAQSLLAGATLNVDDFDDRTPNVAAPRDYHFRAPGFFAQNEVRLAEKWTLLASARLDFHNEFGAFFTPRAAMMYRPASTLTLRLGGGSGFKAPTIFVEQSEEAGFRNVRPLQNVVAENSRSLSFDTNWRGSVRDLYATLNAAFYFTRLDHALIADDDSLRQNVLFLRNAMGATLTRGAELSAKLSWLNWKLVCNYTYTYATQNHGGAAYELELNPRHAFGAILVWENEKSGKLGLETYWTGAQRLEQNPFRERAPSYWIAGVIAEKKFGALRTFINFENIFDTRQTRFDPIIVGDPQAGGIRTIPIYAPLEGRVINGGIRFVL